MQKPNLDLSVNAVELTPKRDFRLIRIFEECSFEHNQIPKFFLKKIIIDYRGMLLTQDYVELIYIKKYLKLFSSKHLVSDEPNDFFKLITRKVGNKQENALQCKFDEKRIIYRAEADCMIDLIHSAMSGYSDKFINHGFNSIEALHYAETVMENKAPRLNEKSEVYVQNAIQHTCVIEAIGKA